MKLALALIIITCTPDNNYTGNDYLNEQGQLKQDLILREEQDGIAGKTGKTWQIKPDGTWITVSWWIDHGKLVEFAHKTGKLCPKQMMRLAQSLQEADLKTIPKAMGKPKPVNDHAYIIKWGNQSSTVYGVTTDRKNNIHDNILWDAPALALEQARQRTRFANTADSIVRLINESQNPIQPK